MPGVEAEQGGVEAEAGGPRLLGRGVHGDQGQDGAVWCCDAAATLLYTVHTAHVPAQRSSSARVSWRATAQTCSFFCDVAVCYNCYTFARLDTLTIYFSILMLTYLY